MWTKIISFFMTIYVALCGFFGIPVSQEVPVTTDTKAVIQLTGNPSTGYTWEYTVEDEKIVKCTGEESQYTGKFGVTGAPSNYYFTFEGVGAGTTVVTFSYLRTWEDKIPEKTIVYRMTVDENLHITYTEING